MILNRHSFLALVLAINLFSCKDDKDDDDNSPGPVSSPYLDAANIELVPGSAVLAAASAALGSVDDVVTSEGANLKLNNVTLNQSTNDPLCSEFAEPWDSNTNDVMLDSNPNYSPSLFYCALFSNTLESSESIRGVLAQNQSITCTIESHFSLTADSYSSTAEELVTGDPVSVTLTDTCWPNGTPDNLTEVPFSSVKIQALDSATDGWTHSIHFKSDAFGIDQELKTFAGNGTFGFARIDNESVSPGVGDDIRMTVDLVNGVLMFNAINDRAGGGGADSAYRTLIRAKISGTIDASTYAISDVSSIRGFYGISGPGFDAANDSDYAWSMYTVDGNPTTGFQWKRFTHQSGGTVTEVNSVCTEGTETCADATSLGTNEEMYALMSRTAVVESEWKNLIESGKPLCEPSDDSDLDFSGAPTFTGNIGQCVNTSASGQFTCSQTHATDDFTKNCSTLFTAGSVEEASELCKAEESEGGQGCCSSSSVFTNAFGAVVSYEVVPLGSGRGNGTSFDCD